MGDRTGRAHSGRRLGRIWPVVAAAAIAGVWLLALAPPAMAPPGDFIAYDVAGNINFTTPDGVTTGFIATSGETESQPSWDANANRIVYTVGAAPGPTDIWLYNMPADSRIKVTFNGRSSSPSIRGNLVAYVREETITAGGIHFPVDNIWTKNLVTHTYTKITHFLPGQDMAGPPHIGATAFTPLAEGISFMWGRRWDSRFVRVVGKSGGTVFNVPTDNLGDTRFSWSPTYVTLYYASRDIGGVFKNHSIHRRHWPTNGDPATETTILTGFDTSWNMSPSVGHQGMSVAYAWTDSVNPSALDIADWNGANVQGIVGPADEPAWFNMISKVMTPPAVKQVGPYPASFGVPGGKSKLRFRTGSRQTVLPTVKGYIYNSAGGLVKVVGPYTKLIGYGYTYWNGKDYAGRYVPPGTYHYRFRVQDQTGLTAYSGFSNVVVH